ncbi:MAG: carbohydrate ABC transporter permease [Candidatus Limnocylindrales bacterium]
MTAATVVGSSPRRSRSRRLALHAFLMTMALIWLFPLAWAVYTSFRPFAETFANGYISLPAVLNFDNYVNAWNLMDLPLYFTNTMIIVIPGVILTLWFASMVAFGVTLFKWRFNLFFLLLFTAGNLLPPQVIIVPLYHLYLILPIPRFISDNGLLYDQYIGIILIHVVFQTGFCTFVLANYMRTLPRELVEASLVDGASVFRIYRSVILPLCRPALAALATLQFTFLYNDFFWALLLMKSGDRRPITSALNNLQGQFFTNNNMAAAGALIVAIPTIVVFLVLQRQFVRGLTLGSTKG